MKKVFLPATLALALMSFVVATVATWKSDGAHSRLGFSITHMGISEVNGQFDKFEVSISTPNADFSGATIGMTAQASTINTGMSMRDDHLRAADFFDVANHPTLTFKSTSVKKDKGNAYTVTGDLTMRGITKPVTFQAIHNGNAKNRAGGDVAGFRMIGTIKRSDFKVGEPGGTLADEVKLIADLEVGKD